MKPYSQMLLAALLLAGSFSLGNNRFSKYENEIELVASTAADTAIRSTLRIPPELTVDFIRWHLIMYADHTFRLAVIYGEAQPNTPGFKKDYHLDCSGTYTSGQTATSDLKGTLYQLESSSLSRVLNLLQLNNQVFHLLDSDKKLMVGNGGWSYTLNAASPVKNMPFFTTVFTPVSLFTDTATQVIFDGRTPCRPFAQENNITASDECFKLKWRLILHRDPLSGNPTYYQINRTLSREHLLTGRWVVKKHPLYPSVTIIQLDPGQPEGSLSFLVGDGNILYFLNRELELYVGNRDFSFTLNKKKR